MYDITSSCADDFINHEEILDTLAYADQNKENSTLIDSIIQKAKKEKDCHTGKPPCFLPVRSRKKMKRSSGLQNRSKKISMETEL